MDDWQSFIHGRLRPRIIEGRKHLCLAAAKTEKPTPRQPALPHGRG